jgi:hypothetical protein
MQTVPDDDVALPTPKPSPTSSFIQLSALPPVSVPPELSEVESDSMSTTTSSSGLEAELNAIDQDQDQQTIANNIYSAALKREPFGHVNKPKHHKIHFKYCCWRLQLPLQGTKQKLYNHIETYVSDIYVFQA